MAVKEVYYTDPDWEAIQAQQNDEVDPFAADKQDDMPNQDPGHIPGEAFSPTNCVILESVHPLQRNRAPLIAQFRVSRPIEDRPIGSATSATTEALVTQSQLIEGVVARNPDTGAITQLDFGTPRRTNPNAAHVPEGDLEIVDLANTTASFLGAGKNGRIPIKRRPKAIFTSKDAK